MQPSPSNDRSIRLAMRGRSTDHVDRLLSRFAEAQGGAVARWQLLASGLDKGVVHRRLASGHLHSLTLAGRPLTGIYSVGRPLLQGLRGWQWAAWLACGPRSVLSHRTAAEVHDLLASSRLEVTVPPNTRRRRDGIRVRQGLLHDRDITAVDGLPVTSWPRTILAVAAVESPKRLALALDRTVTLRIFDRNAVDELLDRRPHAAGARALRTALAVMTDDGEQTRSPAEVDVRWLVLTSDLPRPLVNAPLLGYVADLLWPVARLVVEVDSSRWHDGPFARRDDHRRQAALESAGYAVLRVRASDPPQQILQRVRLGLAARSVDPHR